jgi:hypothetical protein
MGGACRDTCLKTEPTLYRGEPGLVVERRHAAGYCAAGKSNSGSARCLSLFKAWMTEFEGWSRSCHSSGLRATIGS